MRTLASFAEACGGRLQGEDRAYSQVCTDTRTLARGELFWRCAAPRFNGKRIRGAGPRPPAPQVPSSIHPR